MAHNPTEVPAHRAEGDESWMHNDIEKGVWLDPGLLPMAGSPLFWARFAQVEKLLEALPRPRTLATSERASLVGLTEEAYLAATGQIRAQVQQNVEELQKSTPRLPALFRSADVIVGIGDSITDDRASWFEHLRALAPGATFVNLARSGDTSSDALRRLSSIDEVEPDVALIMIGTNDTARFHCRPSLVSSQETLRNLATIREYLGSRFVRQVWLTPLGVDEDMLSTTWSSGQQEPLYSNQLLAPLAEMIQSLEDVLIVDLFDPAGTSWQYEDGIHPSIATQKAVARHVIETVARHERDHG